MEVRGRFGTCHPAEQAHSEDNSLRVLSVKDGLDHQEFATAAQQSCTRKRARVQTHNVLLGEQHTARTTAHRNVHHLDQNWVANYFGVLDLSNTIKRLPNIASKSKPRCLIK